MRQDQSFRRILDQTVHASRQERGVGALDKNKDIQLFDTEANTFAYSDPFRLPDAQAITPLRARTIGVTLRWAPQ